MDGLSQSLKVVLQLKQPLLVVDMLILRLTAQVSDDSFTLARWLGVHDCTLSELDPVVFFWGISRLFFFLYNCEQADLSDSLLSQQLFTPGLARLHAIKLFLRALSYKNNTK